MILWIRSAKIVNPALGEPWLGDILVIDGCVTKMGKDLSGHVNELENSASSKVLKRVINATGLTVMPGLVDMHVHLRDPGFLEKETLETASNAASAGGVTTVLAMPNTEPAMDSPEIIFDLLKRSEKVNLDVYTAACITKGLRGEELCDFSALKNAGAIAFSDDGRPVLHSDQLLSALKRSKEMDFLVTAHCEDLDLAKGGLIHEGKVSKFLDIKGIPAAAEDCGTAREIAAAASIDARIHICHVSTKGSVDLIRDAKRRGVKVTAETAPHYLLLTDESLYLKDADYRMNPPLRTKSDLQALIEALKDGTIDAIATDHAPHSVEEKSEFLKAPNGAIGMETSLSASVTALSSMLSISEIVEKMSTNPANILDIEAGIIQEGCPANLVVFDEEESWVVNENKLHGKSKNTPFKGITLKGKVKATIYRGNIVYQDN